MVQCVRKVSTISACGRREGVKDVSLIHREEGQGLLEYGVVLVLVAVIVVAVLALLGPTVMDMYSAVLTSL